jgi:hypothetical protein
MASAPFNSGSEWLRWEPHIHAPGTVINDQFKGDWEEYLKKIEEADPPVRALGITDYYLTDCYKQVVDKKSEGRLPNCDLIFPNIEMRLDVGTSAGRWTNIHLLVCPDEADHLEKVEQFLQQLQFQTAGQTYVCDRNGLISLGRSNGTKDEKAALKRGAEQFKVSIDRLRQAYEANEWAKANILVAVAGGADGTSGVDEPADQTLRNKIEAFAHIIFSANPNDRAFWLGESKASVGELEANRGGLKPCLHGCDAHYLAKVGQPDKNRYCWIKGSATFDGLRYACIAPHRAFVGEVPPTITSTPSQTIKSIKVSNAPWVNTPEMNFNTGLITIIGARGSGKTALADIVAAGCDAIRPDDRSFLKRAGEKLGDASVELTWANDEKAQYQLKSADTDNHGNQPKATYLSQQFVEKLCASDDIADDLLREIERVIFENHDVTTKGTAHDFEALKDAKVRSSSLLRQEAEKAIAELSEKIGDAFQAIENIKLVKQQIKQQQQTVTNYEADKLKLTPSGIDANQSRLSQINEAINSVNQRIGGLSDQISALEDLQREVERFKQETAPAMFHDLQSRFTTGGLSDDEWKMFRTDFTGDVEASGTGKTQVKWATADT